MTDDPMCFAAFCACSRMCAVSVDTPEMRESNAKAVAKWIRAGLRMEMVTLAAARASLAFCDCKLKPKAQRARMKP